jgi:hypothetical protein
MKWLPIVVAIVSSVACGGGCGSSNASTLTAPAPGPPANIGGSYNATITASSTCSSSLPAATRVLNYIANITQTGTAVRGQLLANVIWNSVTIVGTVSGQTVNFSSFSFSENDTGGGVALVATGTANVAADGSIAGTLSGTYGTPPEAGCNAVNHQLEMVKR